MGHSIRVPSGLPIDNTGCQNLGRTADDGGGKRSFLMHGELLLRLSEHYDLLTIRDNDATNNLEGHNKRPCFMN